MTRLDRYLLRETLPVFAFGLVLYIGLGLLSNILARSAYVGQMPLGGLVAWLGLQVPAIVAQTLPVAVLFAVLLGYGRLARENELLVMQAGGISPRRTARWLLVGGVLLTALSFALAEWVIPWSNKQTVLTWWRSFDSNGGVFRLVGQDLPVGKMRLFFAGYDPAKNELLRVRVQQWEDRKLTVYFAEWGKLEGYALRLGEVKGFALDMDRLPPPDFGDLEQVEAFFQGYIQAQNITHSLLIRLPLSQDDLVAQFSNYSSTALDASHPPSYWLRLWLNPTASVREKVEARANLHAALAQSFAPLVLLWLALPVAIQRASSPGVALGLALVLAVGYYVLFGLGGVVSRSSVWLPEIAMWSANLLALGAGWALGRGVYR
ncbi:LptF/LptG family permease [Calidithermus timidus]|uniref:LptF/LptG family permease n=1 Tax=Calidithermus timidus TaxID=307124 RepID=UPI00035FBC61|nr:LptF/LptG family permease [Calidithermus timidus]